jgi:hypothetical protein
MKNLFIGFIALATSSAALSATTIDGVWSCQLQNKKSTSGAVIQQYISIHSKADGATLFATLSESNGYDQFGYGIGSFQNNVFSGSTKLANPFSLTLGADSNLTGTGQGVDSLHYINDYLIKCTRVW